LRVRCLREWTVGLPLVRLGGILSAGSATLRVENDLAAQNLHRQTAPQDSVHFCSPNSLVMPVLIRREALRLAAVIVVAALLALAGIAAAISRGTSTPALRRQAENALLSGRFTEAERLGRQLMERGDQRARGALIAGQAAARLARYDEALMLLGEMPRNNPSLAVASDTASAHILLTAVPRLTDAEMAVRSALGV